jgi:hypothetical protein
MARQFISVVIAAAAAFGCVAVVGATIARSNIAGPAGDQAYMTTSDFDRVFADAALAQDTASIDLKLRDAGRKRYYGDTLLQSFWVAAIASPYLGAKDAELLRPLNHLPSLRTGNFSPTQSAPNAL